MNFDQGYEYRMLKEAEAHLAALSEIVATLKEKSEATQESKP